jgi:hypothetical protein
VTEVVRERQPDAGGAAADLVLAASERLASTGRVELDRGALAGVVLAIRATERPPLASRCVSRTRAGRSGFRDPAIVSLLNTRSLEEASIGSRLAPRAMITPPRRSLPRLSVTASPAEAVTGELVPVAAGAAETGQLDIELCDRLGEVENGVRSTSQR